MPGIPYGLSCDQFRLRIRNERRVELAFEEHRFFDVRRWKMLDQTDKVITGMKANSDGSYSRFVVDNNRKAYSEKFLLYPIPVTEDDFSSRSEERRVGKECRSRWSPYH